MERSSGRLQGIIAAIGMLVLIFDSSLALEGARTGIELCIKTVIPSLFPFFVLSGMMINGWHDIGIRFAALLTKFMGIPTAASPVLIPAVMGGYPVGAKCVGALYQGGQIERKHAQRMLAFCNNAGPSFLFGMVSGFFPERKWIWLQWVILLSSALLTAAVIPAYASDKETNGQEMWREKQSVILSASQAISIVCCWVVLFRMILSFLNSWFLWQLPDWLQVFLTGILELTNGCCALSLIADVKQRFVLCTCMLTFGGICVLMQTASVTTGLSLGYYIRGKLIQTAFSFLMSCMIISEQGFFFGVLIPIFVISLRKMQNRYGNLSALPV